MIICTDRLSFPSELTHEDWAIRQARVPKRARFIYMLGDSTDAEIMFAWVDAAHDRAQRIDSAVAGSSSK